MGASQLPQDAPSSTSVLIDFDAKRRIAGNITLNSATWADVNNTSFDMALNAVAGDYVEYSLAALNTSAAHATDCGFDVVAVTSGASLSGVGAGGRGVLAWYFRLSIVEGQGGAIILPIALSSGDITAGVVTLRLRYRQATVGDKGFNATTDFPFMVSAKTLRPPA